MLSSRPSGGTAAHYNQIEQLFNARGIRVKTCGDPGNRLQPSSTMSLFQSILDSIENPNHSGSQQDLQGLANLAQLLPAGQGTEQNIQPILGVLGSYLKNALNQQQQTAGPAAAQQTVTNLAQPGVGVQDLQGLFGQSGLNNLIGEIAQRTGLNSQVIMAFLPMLIPVVMKLLASGTHQTDARAPNPVLNGFLGSNQGGGELLSGVFQLASQFLHK
jgi:hypothetical protein